MSAKSIKKKSNSIVGLSVLQWCSDILFSDKIVVNIISTIVTTLAMYGITENEYSLNFITFVQFRIADYISMEIFKTNLENNQKRIETVYM